MALSATCKSSTLLLISIGVLVISIYTKLVIVPYVIDDQVHKTMELLEGTKGKFSHIWCIVQVNILTLLYFTGYEVWYDPPNDIYTKYYFHNVQNPEEIKKGGKPKVMEIGPYVYKQKRIKKDIVPLGDEEIVYGQWISYTFDQDQTEKDGCFNPITNRVCTAR